MDTDRTRSLTYAEMAAAMGITLASAKNLTRRKRWPRTRSNEGHVRVLVPLDYLAESEGQGPPGTLALMKAPLMAAERLSASVGHEPASVHHSTRQVDRGQLQLCSKTFSPPLLLSPRSGRAHKRSGSGESAS
jgi:hypothetical protein